MALSTSVMPVPCSFYPGTSMGSGSILCNIGPNWNSSKDYDVRVRYREKNLAFALCKPLLDDVEPCTSNILGLSIHSHYVNPVLSLEFNLSEDTNKKIKDQIAALNTSDLFTLQVADASLLNCNVLDRMIGSDATLSCGFNTAGVDAAEQYLFRHNVNGTKSDVAICPRVGDGGECMVNDSRFDISHRANGSFRVNMHNLAQKDVGTYECVSVPETGKTTIGECSTLTDVLYTKKIVFEQEKWLSCVDPDIIKGPPEYIRCDFDSLRVDAADLYVLQQTVKGKTTAVAMCPPVEDGRNCTVNDSRAFVSSHGPNSFLVRMRNLTQEDEGTFECVSVPETGDATKDKCYTLEAVHHLLSDVNVFAEEPHENATANPPLTTIVDKEADDQLNEDTKLTIAVSCSMFVLVFAIIIFYKMNKSSGVGQVRSVPEEVALV